MEATAPTKPIHCAICSDAPKENECDTAFGREIQTTITLQCSHSYHKECIQGWFNQKPTCPLCRRDISEVDIMSKKERNHLLAKALVAGDYEGREQARLLLSQGAEITEEALPQN